MDSNLLDRTIIMEEVQVNKGDVLFASVLHHSFDVSVAGPGQRHIK